MEPMAWTRTCALSFTKAPLCQLSYTGIFLVPGVGVRPTFAGSRPAVLSLNDPGRLRAGGLFSTITTKGFTELPRKVRTALVT